MPRGTSFDLRDHWMVMRIALYEGSQEMEGEWYEGVEEMRERVWEMLGDI